jgi:magnesium-transporting ATPase (P-type)
VDGLIEAAGITFLVLIAIALVLQYLYGWVLTLKSGSKDLSWLLPIVVFVIASLLIAVVEIHT